ncbi:MAG: UDP-N-acetylglucosamine 2-epimerase (non-hydrolyzing) [Thermoproteota archaeon]|nr:UDP-N-acetylglucosamine 2-epimerase (non-hydrolyzing) [Candidatus Brockarchaeota archaeon]
MKTWIIIGTRPQIIKSAPVIHECLKQNLDIEIIHTGQHYDFILSQVFLEEFNLPDPKVNLEVGSGSHAYQTGEIMLRLERHIIEHRPSLVLIPGDTNSALAGALTSVKLGIAVAHIEAGARCYDLKMAEEINRRLIDHCSQLLFAPTLNCKKNLEKESVVGEIFLTGDTMYDAFIKFSKKTSDVTNKLGLKRGDYAMLTIHRAENTDDPFKLRNIFEAVGKVGMKIVFPIHPRTRNRLKENDINMPDNILPINPVGYIEMLTLLKNAKLVLTDSGGLQKESFWSRIPCITLREQTEWVETVEIGVNLITGTDPVKILQALEYIMNNYNEVKKRFKNNPFGDGRASERIVKVISSIRKD